MTDFPRRTDIPESIFQAYVDGELSPEQVREVETHLVGSRQAREFVMSLQEEDRLLSDVLLDRSREVAPAKSRSAPARGLALGVIPSVAIASALAAVFGWAIDTYMPTSMAWLNPLKWTGIAEMVFDLMFMIRDEAPQLIELLVAVAATASLSALLTLGVSAVFRRVAGPSTLALLLWLVAGAADPAQALDLRDQETVRIAPSEIISETLMVTGETVLVEGVVDANLFAFAERLVVKGEVRGNIYAIVRNIEIDGVVRGTLHAGSERVDIAGRVEGDLFMGCEIATLRPEAVVTRDFTALCAEISIDGSVGRDLFAGGERIEVRGQVARNADARGRRIHLYDGSSFGGNVEVTAPEGHEAEVDAGASIAGELTRSVHDHDFGRKDVNRYLTASFYLHLAIIVVAMFLVGMAMYAIFPAIFAAQLDTVSDFFRTLGFGGLALLGTPLAIVLLFITVVGIPVSVIGLFLYITAIFVSGVLVSALVGRTVTNSEDDTTLGFGVALATGLLILLVLSIVPYLGGLIRVLIVLTGLGLIVEHVLRRLRRSG